MAALKSIWGILVVINVLRLGNIVASNLKIVNGNAAVIDQFPWVVSIDHREVDGDLLIQCTGTLVAPNWVLTSATCLDIETSDGYMLTVRAGTIYRNKTIDQEQVQYSTEYYHHRSYQRSPLQYNVALIKLPENFKLNEHVDVIDFYTNTIDIANVTLIGWGTLHDSDSTSPITENLMYGSTMTISQFDCTNAYDDLTSVDIGSDTLCTNTGLTQTCLYDQGGPLVYNIYNTTYQVGVIDPPYLNESIFLCSELPSRYTRISQVVDWIRDVTNGGLSSYMNANILFVALFVLVLIN